MVPVIKKLWVISFLPPLGFDSSLLSFYLYWTSSNNTYLLSLSLSLPPSSHLAPTTNMYLNGGGWRALGWWQFKRHLVGTEECEGGEGREIREVTVHQSAMCQLLLMWIGFLMGVEGCFHCWSIGHGVTCLICLLFFFTEWPALFLSFFLSLSFWYQIKSNCAF
jgi:hypothetical protein